MSLAPTSRAQGWRAVLASVSWLASEKLLRLVLAFVVGVWVARHLGPHEYGRLSLALSWVGLLGSIAWFGVGDAITRELVRQRADEGRLLGSALLLRGVGTLLALAAIGGVVTAGVVPAGIVPLVLLLAWMLPAGELTGGLWLWFQSHLRMAPAVMARNAALLAGALARLGVIAAGGGVMAMAGTFVAEAVLGALGLVLAYRLSGQHFGHWRFDLRHAAGVFGTGWPILLSAVVVTLNSRVDQLLLGALAGPTEVGLYAAAARFSEIWWLVPVLVMQSVAPRYLFAPALRPVRVTRNVAWLIVGLAALALPPCLLLGGGAQWITAPLLGTAYRGTEAVLAVHVWIAFFVFIDTAQNQWLLAQGRQALLVHKALGTVLVNAALGWWLIPQWGAVGAAGAALAAHAWSACLFPWMLPAGTGLRALQRRALATALRLPRAWRHLSRLRRTTVTRHH
jgi:polysaccharide transporter, PST family